MHIFRVGDLNIKYSVYELRDNKFTGRLFDVPDAKRFQFINYRKAFFVLLGQSRQNKKSRKREFNKTILLCANLSGAPVSTANVCVTYQKFVLNPGGRAHLVRL